MEEASYNRLDIAEAVHGVRAAGGGGGEAQHCLLQPSGPEDGHGGGHLCPQQRRPGRHWVSGTGCCW